jgi:hypothetical protein
MNVGLKVETWSRLILRTASILASAPRATLGLISVLILMIAEFAFTPRHDFFSLDAGALTISSAYTPER